MTNLLECRDLCFVIIGFLSEQDQFIMLLQSFAKPDLLSFLPMSCLVTLSNLRFDTYHCMRFAFEKQRDDMRVFFESNVSFTQLDLQLIDSHGFQICVERGHLQMLRDIVNRGHFKLDKTDLVKCVAHCCINNHIPVAVFLIQSGFFTTSDAAQITRKCFSILCVYGRDELFHLFENSNLLDQTYIHKRFKRMLHTLCTNYYTPMLQMLKHSRLFCEPQFLDDVACAFREECVSGKIDLVRALFELTTPMHIKNSTNHYLHQTCAAGHVAIVLFLVEKNLIERHDVISYHCLQSICDHMQTDMLQLLLENKLIEKQDLKDLGVIKCMRSACKYGCNEFIQFVWDLRVFADDDWKSQSNKLFLKTCIGARLHTTLLLVNDLLHFTEFDFKSQSSLCLRIACKYGHLKLLEYFLNLKIFTNVDFQVENDYCLRKICKHAHMELLPKVLPFFAYESVKQCREIAVENKADDIVHFIDTRHICLQETTQEMC